MNDLHHFINGTSAPTARGRVDGESGACAARASSRSCRAPRRPGPGFRHTHRSNEAAPCPQRTRGLGSNGTKSSAKVFSFLNTRSDFLTVAVVPALLATPSAALGDLASPASVAALPTRGDDVLEDHGGSSLCPRAGHSAPG